MFIINEKREVQGGEVYFENIEVLLNNIDTIRQVQNNITTYDWSHIFWVLLRQYFDYNSSIKNRRRIEKILQQFKNTYQEVYSGGAYVFKMQLQKIKQYKTIQKQIKQKLGKQVFYVTRSIETKTITIQNYKNIRKNYVFYNS